MLTLIEVLTKSTEYLEKKGIDSARLNAELLLAEVLNCKRLDIYLRFDKPLAEDELVKYREFISRRGKYEPLQYIVGYTEFYGQRINVTKDVLIPRPETEILVESIVDQFRSVPNLKIIDIGTGSGNISIALAKNLISPSITTIDTSQEAIIVAKNNCTLNNLNGEVDFVHGDILTHSFQHEYDIVVSNPPYISLTEYESLQNEVKYYEPKNALTDFHDGLFYFESIAHKMYDYLTSGGKIFFEIGFGQSAAVKEILTNNKYSHIEIIKDYQNIDRVIFGVKV